MRDELIFATELKETQAHKNMKCGISLSVMLTMAVGRIKENQADSDDVK
jgi:hypothetical protein